ncbi:hypothetical protein [Streptomyces sp. NBC_01244]|uniref:hypothetical protein n=1 Tax=Streptomyces sp. NBC_01244 TaxID=2903797 RepID=UPI002E14F698|nr:hypothetical protein OG247_24270 [Streptomyces sp. NBC_01244]
MESPAENKRSAALALVVMGLLLIGALVVFTVFDGEADAKDPSDGKPAATAEQGNNTGTTGGDGNTGTQQTGASAAVPPIVTPEELAEAHEAMAAYMAGLGTYKYTDQTGTWAKPLLELTVSDDQMIRQTALPTGKDWATCRAARCTSVGKATVVRDALIADDLARGSGRMVSSVVSLTSVRSENGKQTRTENNAWLVSSRKDGGKWKVSAFDLHGLGNVGASDKSGE